MVYTLALLIPRVSEGGRFPVLPSEMWVHIMSFLGHYRRTAANPRDVEKGWIPVVATRVVPVARAARKLSLSSESCDMDFMSDDDDILDSEGRRARNSTSKLRCRELFPDDEMDISDDEALGGRTRDDVGVLSFASSRRFSWV